MKIKVRWPGGSQAVTLADDALTLQGLREAVEATTSIACAEQLISAGFPPRKLDQSQDATTLLTELDIG